MDGEDGPLRSIPGRLSLRSNTVIDMLQACVSVTLVVVMMRDRGPGNGSSSVF